MRANLAVLGLAGAWTYVATGGEDGIVEPPYVFDRVRLVQDEQEPIRREPTAPIRSQDVYEFIGAVLARLRAVNA